MLEFTDFECRYCRKFATGIWPQIDRAYVTTGVVRFVLKHHPTISPRSRRAAEITECAGRQSKFWEATDLLFAGTLIEISQLKTIDSALDLKHS
jgi:protein-disulfide isomerase